MLEVLLISFVVLMALGLPVCFSLALSSVLALLVGDIPITLLAQRMVTGLDSFPLMAVPLFILAGELMNASGTTQRTINLAQVLVGHIRGGLSHVNVVSSIIFAGVSGSAAADAAGLGAVLIPAMVRQGYDEDWAVGVTSASATIGPVLPPSILMIIYASMTQLSVGKLFLAGIIPGLMIGMALLVIGYVLALRRHMVPQARASAAQIWSAYKQAWAFLLAPLIILVGITSGIFTATEAGAVAVGYILLLGFAYRELTWAKLKHAIFRSALSTATLLFIIAAANVFTWILAREQFPRMLANLLQAISTNPQVTLLMVIIFLLLIGLFIESLAAMMIVIPVTAPIALAVGLDPIHFALVQILCLLIGALTPPVGVLLFVSCSVSGIPLRKVTRLIWVFVAGMLAVTLLVAYVPALATFLPQFLI